MNEFEAFQQSLNKGLTKANIDKTIPNRLYYSIVKTINQSKSILHFKTLFSKRYIQIEKGKILPFIIEAERFASNPEPPTKADSSNTSIIPTPKD